MIDDLYRLIVESPSPPFMPRKAVIDREEVENLINEIKRLLPREIQDAKRILQQRERIIQNAKRRAEEIVHMAMEKADHLTSEEKILQDAKAQAEEIIRKAETESIKMRKEAEEYAIRVFRMLESKVSKVLEVVRKTYKDLEADLDRISMVLGRSAKADVEERVISEK